MTPIVMQAINLKLQKPAQHLSVRVFEGEETSDKLS